MSKKSDIFRLSMTAVALLGIIAVAFAPAAAADDGPSVEVIAEGLDNPRGLNFGPEGALYVAEAGRGGAGPCVGGAEGEVCFGETGAITRIWRGEATRIAEGLPSLADPASGGGALGPHDISFLGRGEAYYVVGLGNNPEVREVVGDAFGQLVKLPANGTGREVADLAQYEVDENPEGTEEIDSNPYGVLALPGKQVVVDAGANALLQVDANGEISTLAVFPARPVDFPFPGFPMQAVPTTVALGPDGAYYVGQLTGFPFPEGGARIYRVEPGEDPNAEREIYADGFTNVVDIAFDDDGNLYVVEIDADSIIVDPPFNGALIRVAPDGSRETILDQGLFAPAGVAVGRDGALYVTNCGVCAGGGQVLRIEP
jgi:DNA-binding beta-propeller fold protein YncE